MRRFVLSLVFSCCVAFSLSQNLPFDQERHPPEADYADESAWAALPFRNDVADVLPENEKWVSDSMKRVDVFYVHPTVYQKGPFWNASLDMRKVNRKTDKYPVRLQASVFNRSCRVYAPRYRQAVVKVFHERSEDGDKALNLAYQDVKRAFQHYMERYNNGRPFIIAGHSQGTYHARRLLRECIDTTGLRRKMVAAYVIGFAVNDSMFTNLNICNDPTETGCYVSWMSYKEGFEPEGWWFSGTQSLNPQTWSLDTNAYTSQKSRGSVVLNPKRVYRRQMTTQLADVGGQVLWVRTRAPWFRMMKNLHVADYGLFYMDIRKNVEDRINAFYKRN